MLALAGLDVRSDQVEMGCCGFSLIRDSVHLIFFTSEAFGGFVGVCVVQAKCQHVSASGELDARRKRSSWAVNNHVTGDDAL